MPEPKRPLKVFLCHTSADKPKVRELYRYLKKRGIQPWFDEEDLVGGQDWQVEIPKALATSDAIIICLTKNSVDKEGYIQKEIKFALDKALEMPEGRIFLIPVKFEECEVPFTLSRYQWVDLTIESGYAKMMKALKFRASQLERSTVELPKPPVTIEDKRSLVEKRAQETIEKAVREEAEREAVEKARLEAEEQAKTKTLQEKTERESAERAERERVAKEEREKEARQKTAIKIQREYEKMVKKAKRDLWWGKLKIDIRYRFQVIYIYRVPILILLGTLAFVTPLLIRLSNLIPDVITTFSNTPTATIGLTLAPQSSTNSTEAFIPLETLTPSPTSTEVLVVAPTSLPTEITDAKGVLMVLVPSGEFIWGNGDYQRTLDLDAYYIDKFEVTNALYKMCVNAGVCEYLIDTKYSGNPNYANHPVVYLVPYQADLLCKWRGAYLPNGYQWEKAARGTDGRAYPWGNEPVSCSNANQDNCVGGTTEVGSYESGVSPYGVYDMVGNVSEIISDVDFAGDRVIRGSSWVFDFYNLVYESSSYDVEGRGLNRTGFRCAKDATP